MTAIGSAAAGIGRGEGGRAENNSIAPAEGMQISVYVGTEAPGTLLGTFISETSYTNTARYFYSKAVPAQLAVTVEATAVIVGETLAKSTLTGTFKDATTEATVPGTLAWTDVNKVVNETGNFEWTFTPSGTTAYNVITGMVGVVAN